VSPTATLEAASPLAARVAVSRQRDVPAGIWLAAGFLASLPFTVQFFRPGETWWHLALGRLILSGGGIPSAEPFSFLATQHPWVDQQWLLEAGIAALVRIGGAGLASLAMGLAGSLALLLAALAVQRARRVAPAWRASAMVLAAATAQGALGVAGETVSVLGVAATLLVVCRWRDGSQRAPWILPPLFALWANLDAGFVAGIAVLGTALLVDALPRGLRLRRLPPGGALLLLGIGAGATTILWGLLAGGGALLVLWTLLRPVPTEAGRSGGPLLAAAAAATAATLLNPAGPGLYAYILETATSPGLSQLLAGFGSPNFHDAPVRMIEVTAAILVITWTLARRVRAADLLLAALFFLATLEAERTAAFFAIVALPQLAEYGAAAWAAHRPERLRGWAARFERRRAVAAVSLLVAVLAGSLAITFSRVSPAATAAFERSQEPEAAAAYVAAHFPGARLLSSASDAGYLADRFPKGRVVFLYDEVGIFGNAPVADYRRIVGLSPGWQTLLARYGIRHAVVGATSADTAALLDLGWTANCYDAASGRVVLSAGGPPLAIPALPAAAPSC
jgi:hypothetical protein